MTILAFGVLVAAAVVLFFTAYVALAVLAEFVTEVEKRP